MRTWPWLAVAVTAAAIAILPAAAFADDAPPSDPPAAPADPAPPPPAELAPAPAAPEPAPAAPAPAPPTSAGPGWIGNVDPPAAPAAPIVFGPVQWQTMPLTPAQRDYLTQYLNTPGNPRTLDVVTAPDGTVLARPVGSDAAYAPVGAPASDVGSFDPRPASVAAAVSDQSQASRDLPAADSSGERHDVAGGGGGGSGV